MAKMETNHSSPTPGPSSTEEINFPRADNQLPTKKKRSLPGMPDPDSEVIALSPKTLLAKNRFVCEICNKGFQRDQNLQLHRRGHNLPWKLRQRINKDIKKRVYVCPEPSCVHHEPSRALGDLTGIKKHFCRKHGEKKFKCERCSKKYAVQSDRKAHMKTCGTKEYRCDCGTLFSRRDSFVTHRAFCDALAQESTAAVVRSRPPSSVTNSGEDLEVPPVPAASSPPPTGVLSPVLPVQSSAELPENQATYLPPPDSVLSTSTTVTAASMVFASMLSPSHQSSSSSFTGSFLCPMDGSDRPAIDPISLSLSSSLHGSSSLFPSTSEDNRQPHYIQSPQPALSATALLQKAAQMGATSSNPSFFNGLWLPVSSSTDHQDYNVSTMPPATTTTSYGVKLEKNAMASGLGLGLPCGGSSGYSDGLMVSSSGYSDGLMVSSSDLFGDKPTTLDFLGLGMGGGGEGSPGGFSAFLSSISGGLDVAANTFAGVGPTGDGWDDDPSERKPSIL